LKALVFSSDPDFQKVWSNIAHLGDEIQYARRILNQLGESQQAKTEPHSDQKQGVKVALDSYLGALVDLAAVYRDRLLQYADDAISSDNEKQE
jgi:hypothetical protein